MTDALNDILIECCKLRGCYPLMHRTLFEFSEFCEGAIFGVTEYHNYLVNETEKNYPGTPFVAIRKEERERARRIHERWHDWYVYGDDELLKLAEAFLTYCREQYGPIKEAPR